MPHASESTQDPSLAAAILASVRRMVHGGSLEVPDGSVVAKTSTLSAMMGIKFSTVAASRTAGCCLQGTRAVVM